MGQGKSNAARVVMAGAALDPIAELWVFVFANNGDFDAYQPRLSRYHRGVDDTTITAALDALHTLYEEVGRREGRLAALGAKKVTRPLAEKHPDLRPLVALFSECHELFGDPTHGQEAADLAVQTMRRARKTAITLGFDTQSSRADAIPPKIVELVKLNACFAVKSWRSNDGFLGDGSFQAGIRATELRMGKDVGTSILTGATAERFEIVKWFYIEVDDDTGFDAATDIIARAMTAIHPTIPANREISDGVANVVPRDLLDDLDQVLGAEKIGSADVPALLRDLAPGWAPYQRLTGTALRAILHEDYGITVPRAHNTWPLNPATVRHCIAQRAAQRAATDPDGEVSG
jgi:S-DNA-T family DNA segregation ATPase FtsK/SpoIIIE